ncbi:hypothetical protein [Arthrobacter sp. ISL-69]|uniref:hypothetical protein n=1 Tax=Arthrobacter sp. ISL-69 TaxID=2819113 RepID=UPI001BE9A40D|nr:hypothetical protein [Arthrobacter sp. ISL-69]MBT2539017.1 hypothetical protein [Arthrobacter sp. ISL-69]
MFDAQSTVAVDADAPMMVMDTSALIGSIGASIVPGDRVRCHLAGAAVTNPDGGKLLVAYDQGKRYSVCWPRQTPEYYLPAEARRHAPDERSPGLSEAECDHAENLPKGVG